MQNLIECVPNSFEGRDQNIIRQITDVTESVEDVSLMDFHFMSQIAFIGKENETST